MPEISIVLPAYNESTRIIPTLEKWVAQLTGMDAEILVASDGSTDDTVAVATAFAATHPMVRVLDLQPNRGKGGAVRAGMLAAQGNIRFYADADAGIHPRHLPAALEKLQGGVDMVISRRDLGEYAREEKSFLRLFAGAAVQLSRRLLMITWVTDTQAGFKGFRAQIATEIFSRTQVDGFAFDLEVLYLARRLGARIAQVPVSVTYQADSTYNVRRHLPVFLADIWRVRRNAWQGRYRVPAQHWWQRS